VFSGRNPYPSRGYNVRIISPEGEGGLYFVLPCRVIYSPSERFGDVVFCLENFPEGLYKLIKNLAAADHISVDEEVVRLLLEAMYGPNVLQEVSPTVPLTNPDAVGSAPSGPKGKGEASCQHEHIPSECPSLIASVRDDDSMIPCRMN
jgi:hypothetical protein